MSFYELVDRLWDDTLRTSLWAFRAELVICATIVAILLAKTCDTGRRLGVWWLALGGALAALALAAPWTYLQGGFVAGEFFGGMLVDDGFALYMRSLVLVCVVILAVLVHLAGLVEKDDETEFFVLVLGAALGMCVMVAANHMMMVFLGMEMASVPSYVLAGILKQRRTSSEAALKFAVFGAGTAGVMLYGISLVSGVLGSAHVPTMAARLAELASSQSGTYQAVLVLGALMMLVGLAFKLSAVPFHFWTPDVFEGAAAEVGAFLSVASKAAALGLLARLAVAFGRIEPTLLVGVVMVLAAVTCTFGNLAAYGQTNMKRLLAYSTIAHAGYLMMPVAAAVAALRQPEAARAAIAALAFYAAIYLFMNLGAFGVTAFLRNVLESEEIRDYAGLVRRSPGLVVCTAIILFSLVGLPPLAGFSAKFAVFASLLDAELLGLLIVGVVNTVLSLFYYLRVVRVMALEPEPAGPVPSHTGLADRRVPLASPAGLFCLAMTLPLVVLFVWWGPFPWAQSAARSLVP